MYSPVNLEVCEPTGFCGGYIWWAHGLSGTAYDVHDFQSARGSAARILHLRFDRPVLEFVLRSQSTAYPNNRIVAFDSMVGGSIIAEHLMPVGVDVRDSIVVETLVAGKGGIRRIEITPDPAGAAPGAPSGWGEGMRMRVEFGPDTNCVTGDRVLDDMHIRREMKRVYDQSVKDSLESAGYIAEPDDKSGGFQLRSTDDEITTRPPRLPVGAPLRSICHSITPGADPHPGDGFTYEAGFHTHIVSPGVVMNDCPIGQGKTASNGPSGWDYAGLQDLSGRMYIIDPNSVWRVFRDGSKKAFPRRDRARQCTMF